jgi:hypothetical protein
MTVAELRKKLEQFGPGREVRVGISGFQFTEPIDAVRLSIAIVEKDDCVVIKGCSE